MSSDTMASELFDFLKAYEVGHAPGPDVVPTHTSLSPNMSYDIPSDMEGKLKRLVANAVADNHKIYIAERPQPVGPLRWNVNTVYNVEYNRRQHTEEHIQELLRLGTAAIREVVELSDSTPLVAYVSQRKDPYRSHGNVKDGMHVEFPDLQLSRTVQHAVRNKLIRVMDRFLTNPEIGILDVKNTPPDIIDPKVISSSGWLMYGCAMPGRTPYSLHGVYTQKNALSKSFAIERPEISGKDQIYRMVQRCSHTRDAEETHTYRPQLQGYIDSMLEQMQNRRGRSTVVRIRKRAQVRKDDKVIMAVKEAKLLVPLLDEQRANNTRLYEDVGRCLYNISAVSLYETWLTFARKCGWFDENTAEDEWAQMAQVDCTLDVGSLHRWARHDTSHDATLYQNAMLDILEPYIMNSLDGTSHNMAQVVFKMFEHQYKCLDRKGNVWAEFRGHHWKISHDGSSLKEMIGTNVFNMYAMMMTRNLASSMDKDSTVDDANRAMELNKKLSEHAIQLRQIQTKEKLMKECILSFYDEQFAKNVDRNPKLLGFENGVYDMEHHEFRDGEPQDLVSMSTGLDFPDFNDAEIDIENETSSIPEVNDIFDFMQKVFPIDDVRRYTWQSMASFIEGFNAEERMHIWTGSGGNGKSKLVELIERALGAYAGKVPVTLLTKSRTETGQATPELAAVKLCRFVSMQEPEQDATLNAGFMKDLAGQDKQYTRGLYEMGSSEKMLFSMVLMCNEKPKLTDVSDDGTWRRLVVVDFISRFVSGEPKGPYEFVRDTSLTENFDHWAPWFMVLLTKYYKAFRRYKAYMDECRLSKSKPSRTYMKENNIVGYDPSQVPDIHKATLEYRKESDSAIAFFHDNIVEQEDYVLKLEDAYGAYKEWYSDEYGTKPPSRPKFKKEMERTLKQRYGTGRNAGWHGYALNNLEEEPSIDESVLMDD